MTWEDVPDDIKEIIMRMTDEMNDILRAEHFYAYILTILGYNGPYV